MKNKYILDFIDLLDDDFQKYAFKVGLTMEVREKIKKDFTQRVEALKTLIEKNSTLLEKVKEVFSQDKLYADDVIEIRKMVLEIKENKNE